MIFISAGLQKSGSGLFFNLTNDMLIAGGGKDIRNIRQKYHLEAVIKHYNCNLGSLSSDTLNDLLRIHKQENSFVVKTHSGPSTVVKTLMNQGIVKVTCIYRDPRDVILSAVDHGEKLRKKGDADHIFATCTSVENTLPIVKKWLDNGIMKWLVLDDVLTVKYENLIKKPVEELQRLGEFLCIDTEPIDFETLYSRYKTEKLDDFQKDYLHFNVGSTERYRSVMPVNQLNMCSRYLSMYLRRMGYPV